MCGCAVFLRAMYEHFSCSTSSPELGNVNFLNTSCRWEEVSCGFHLHFLNSQSCCTSFHVHICHQYVFLAMSTQISWKIMLREARFGSHFLIQSRRNYVPQSRARHQIWYKDPIALVLNKLEFPPDLLLWILFMSLAFRSKEKSRNREKKI